MSSSYLVFLRRNPQFRRLWYGQIVSEMGDWFHTIALYTLLLKLTHSGEAVGGLMMAQFLPAALVGPWAGTVVDRLPRRRVMVGADLIRAGLVLLLLLIRDDSMVWLAYVVTPVMVAMSSFFEPARAAAVATLVERRDLVSANAISSATWSCMLAVGAALGGFTASALGVHGAFLIDSVSFLLSALLLMGLRMEEPHLATEHPRPGMLREGLEYLGGHRVIALYASVKGLWSLGAGIMLVLTLFGERVFTLGTDGALSIGLLYAARGLGAGVGPFLARRFGDGSVVGLRRALGPAFLCTGLGYALLGYAPTLLAGAAAVFLAHLGGSTQWVYSTALLQMEVPNRLRGRVFAVELTLYTLASALSNYLVGLGADAGLAPATLSMGLAGSFVLTGTALLFACWKGPEVPGGGTEDSAATEC
ncbi:MAG: MFS transporter [Armatimonadetes bacterium]|nr:MFS transporter [Armatimonadota bacterium]